MKNIYLIGFMLLCFIAQPVSAQITNGLEHYWSFDVDSDDEQGNLNGTVTGVNFNTTDCVIGNCYNFDGSGRILYDATASYSGDFSLSFWIKIRNHHQPSGGYSVVYGASGSSNSYAGCRDSGGNDYAMIAITGLERNRQLIQNIETKDIYTHIIITRQGTTLTFYQNTSSLGTYDPQAGQWDFNQFGRLAGLTAYDLDANIDEIGIWNRVLNSTEISQLFNNGAGYNPLAPVPQAIDIEIITPRNNSANNTNPMPFVFNVTSIGNNSMSCNLTIDDVLNQTNNSVFNNVETTLYVPFSNDTSINWSVSCRAGNASTSSGLHYFTYDTTEPLIVLTRPSTNNNTRVQANRSFILDAYATDSYLFRTNLTILNSSGGIMYNDYKDNLTGNTTYIWNQTVNMATWPPGVYSAIFQATDSHTSNKIKNFKPKKDNKDKKLTYKSDRKHGEKEISISLKSSERQLDNFYDVKKKDRHSPVYEFKKGSKGRKEAVFRVESKEKLVYLSDSPFKAHLVTAEGMRGVWIDAELVDDPTANVLVEKVTDYIYDIYVYTHKDKIEFESLGGLNFNEVKADIIIQPNVTVRVNETATGNLLVNFTAIIGNSSNYANNTNETTIYVDPNGQYTVSANKSQYVIASQLINVTTENINVTLQASTAGVFLTFYDEKTQDKLTGVDIDIEVLSTVGNTSQEHTTNTGEQIVTGLAFGEYEIRYAASGYFTRTFYATLNTSTVQYINLYLLNETLGTRIIHTVTDEDSDPLEDITIKLQRNYVSGTVSEFKTVQMAKTNFEGRAPLAVELYDVWYKIIYIDSAGNIIQTTEPTPFFETDTSNQIQTGEDNLEGWRTWNTVSYNLSYIHLANNVSYARLVYNDVNNVLRWGCLRLQRITATEWVDICNNCTSSDSATLTCTFDRSIEGNYKAVVTVDTNTENSPNVVESLFYLVQNKVDTGRDGVFMAFLLVGSMSFMGLATITGSMVLMLLGVILVTTLTFISGFNLGMLYFIVILGLMIVFLIRRAYR